MSLVESIEVLAHEVSLCEPVALSGEDAARLVERLARLEKVCRASRSRLAVRAAECGVHREANAASPEQWLARITGAAVGKARSELETVAALEAFSATGDAVRRGELSLEQAAEVVRTASEVPDAEPEMVEAARVKGLRGLQDRGRKIRAAHEDSDVRYRRQQRLRRASQRVDAEGMVNLSACFTPEIGALVAAVVEREADRLYRKASKAERRTTPHTAFVADALANLVLGRTETGMAGADVVVVVDLAALKRGHLHDGETCHIPGIGDVPVTLAREIAADAFLKAVVYEGTDIKKIRHFGRTYPAELTTLLRIGAPPDFEGTVCSEAGCERRLGLERDHVDPVANGGPTCWENLRWRCRPHHRSKTERDRKAGLLGHRPRGPDPPRQLAV